MSSTSMGDCLSVAGYWESSAGSPGLCAALGPDAGGVGVDLVAEAGAAGFAGRA